nr:hypothetical protein Cry52Nrm2_p079 [Cryptomonas curvata]
MINRKFFFDWLKNLKANNLWNKIKILKINNYNRAQKIIHDSKYLNIKKNPKKFSSIILNCRQNVLLLVHRHVLFKIYKKLFLFELFSFIQNIYLNHILKKLKIIVFSNFILKEIFNLLVPFMIIKSSLFVYEVSIERTCYLNILLGQNLNDQLTKINFLF